ncbi:hypothetical protein HWV62_7168 [Athelia sp. TMB]|nr:hypothetical protein HWV62_7168 [Athelia sp. TMB]
MLALLGFTLMKEDSPVSTKIELACLGLIGTFWLSLGAYLATSDSDDAEVECYSTTDSVTDVVEMPGYNTRPAIAPSGSAQSLLIPGLDGTRAKALLAAANILLGTKANCLSQRPAGHSPDRAPTIRATNHAAAQRKGRAGSLYGAHLISKSQPAPILRKTSTTNTNEGPAPGDD